jgi:hypothetical protein
VPKTAGTSLNQAFLTLSDLDPTAFYDRLGTVPGGRLLAPNGRIFVGWNDVLIDQGKYFYAFSHFPAHELRVPAKTYTITCLRNPVARVASYWNMLANDGAKGGLYGTAGAYRKWWGMSFLEFIDKCPRGDLLAQVYMFSKSYDPQEAFEGIQRCSTWFFTEEYEEGAAKIAKDLKLDLPMMHIRRGSRDRSLLTADEERRAQSLLEPEFKLMEMLRKSEGTHQRTLSASSG